MTLTEQILSFLFSFLYGIITFFIFKIIKKYIYNVKKIYNFLNSLLFFTNITLIYFKIFYCINGGIIKLYFILITTITFLYLNKKFTKNM
jgi:hypothetical protein